MEALRERAQIIVEAERTHPGQHKYHTYMHFAEAADSSEPAPQEWEGITGRMKQLLGGKIDEVEEKIDQVKAEVKEVRAEVKAQVMKLDADMQEANVAMKSEMREIKDLLASIASKTK